MAGRALLAIFVGGKSRRMGEPKGLLPVPGGSESILEALLRAGRDAGLDSVLVGDAKLYAALADGVTRIDDDPPGAGPLAGLQAAVRYAAGHGYPQLITLACDMPYVTSEVLRHVVGRPSDAIVLAPRRGQQGPWEPMLARYDVARLVDLLAEAIAGGQRSFQKLFASIEVDGLPLTPAIERALQDWDTPEDLAR
jgi:molybdopterin-guanine dinucleotide biosynthesis protein A